MHYLSVNEVAEILKVTRHAVLLWCRKNKFPNAFKENSNINTWKIPSTDIEELVDKVEKEKQLENYLSIDDVAEILEVTRDSILNYCNNGIFPNAVKSSLGLKKWKIPRADVEKLIKNQKKIVKSDENFIQLARYQKFLMSMLKQ